jgi:hypothetical protein
MGTSQSKIDLYAAIRRDHQGGMSQRALQRKHNVTWRTVRRALDGKWREPRRTHRRWKSRLESYQPLIDGILQADLDAPREVAAGLRLRRPHDELGYMELDRRGAELLFRS